VRRAGWTTGLPRSKGRHHRRQRRSGRFTDSPTRPQRAPAERDAIGVDHAHLPLTRRGVIPSAHGQDSRAPRWIAGSQPHLEARLLPKPRLLSRTLDPCCVAHTQHRRLQREKRGWEPSDPKPDMAQDRPLRSARLPHSSHVDYSTIAKSLFDPERSQADSNI
jgi:hypothetical protein